MSSSLESTAPVPKVYDAILRVMRALAERGISKDRKQTQANYMFRGIDDVYEALCGVLVSERLLMLPRVVNAERHEVTTKNGAVMTHLILSVNYLLISPDDGSQVLISVVGEGFDSGDKASGKAMSTAYKYAAFQTFCIPVEGVDVEQDDYRREAASSTVERQAFVARAGNSPVETVAAPGPAKAPHPSGPGGDSYLLRCRHIEDLLNAKTPEAIAKIANAAAQDKKQGRLVEADFQAVVERFKVTQAELAKAS